MKLRLPHLLRRLLTAAMTVTSVTVGTANSSYAADAMSPTTLNAGVNDTENTELQAYRLRMQGGASSSYTLSGEMSDLLEDETGTGETGVEGFESPLGDTGSASAAAFSLGDDAAAANAPLSELLPGEQGENLTTGETPSNVGQGGTTGSLDAPGVASVGADAAEASGTFALTRDASELTELPWNGTDTEGSSNWSTTQFGQHTVTEEMNMAASHVTFGAGEGIEGFSTNVILTSNVTVGSMTISGGGYTFSSAGDAGNFLITTGSLSAVGGGRYTIPNISVADSGSIIVNGTELTLVNLTPTNPSAPIQFSNGGKLTIGNANTSYGVFSGKVTVSGTPDAQLHLYTDATTDGRVHLLDTSEGTAHLDVYIHGNLALNLAEAQNNPSWTLTTVRSADLYMDANSTIFVRANEDTPLTPANNIYMQGNLALDVAEGVTADSTTLTSQISLAPSFSGELEKTGAGSITLSGNLSTTSLKVSAGTLNLTGSSIASDAYSVASGATLQFSGDADMAAATSALLNATGEGNIAISGQGRDATTLKLAAGSVSSASGALSLSALTLDMNGDSKTDTYNLSSYTSMNWDAVTVKYHGQNTTFKQVTVGSQGASLVINDVNGDNITVAHAITFDGLTSLNGALNITNVLWKYKVNIGELTGTGSLTMGSTNNMPSHVNIDKLSDYTGALLVSGTASELNIKGDSSAAISGISISGGTINFAASGVSLTGAIDMSNASNINFKLNAGAEATSYTVTEINTSTSNNFNRNVTIDSGVTVNASALNNSWGMGALDVDGTLNVSGNLKFSTGGGTSRITGDGAITATTAQFVHWGTYDISVNQLTVNGDMTLECAHQNQTLTLSGGTLTVKGTVNLTDNDASKRVVDIAGGTWELAGGGTFSGGELKLTSGSLVQQGGTTTISNTFAMTGGLLDVQGGSLAITTANTTINGGSITVSGGSLDVEGSYTLGAEQTLSVLTATANAVQLGGLTLAGGDMVFDAGMLSGDTAALSVGTLSLSAGTTTQNITFNNADYLESGRYLLSGNWTALEGLSFTTGGFSNGSANVVVQDGSLYLDYASDLMYTWDAGDGNWNYADTNWDNTPDGSAEGNMAFVENKGAVFESDANVTVTEAVSVDKLVVRDDATVSITETAALTAQSIEVLEGATLAFETAKAGYSAANITGAGTVELKLTNETNTLNLGADFTGETYVTAGKLGTANAQVGETLRLADGVDLVAQEGDFNADLVLEGETNIQANAPVKFNGTVTGGGTLTHSLNGYYEFHGVVDLHALKHDTDNEWGREMFFENATFDIVDLVGGQLGFQKDSTITTLRLQAATKFVGFGWTGEGDANSWGNESYRIATGTHTIGEATIAGGTVYFNGTTTIDSLAISGGTVNFNGATDITTATISGGTTTFANSGSVNLGVFQQSGGVTWFKGDVSLDTLKLTGGTVTLHNVNNDTDAVKNIGEIQLSGDGTNLYVFFDDERLTSIDLASVKVAGTTNLGTYKSNDSYQGLINIANLSNAEAGSTATLTLSSGSKTTRATAINVNGGSFAGTLKLENVAESGGKRRLAVNLNAQNVASGAVIEFVDKNNDYNYVALGLGATEVHVAGLTGTSTTNVGEIYGYQINSGAEAFNNVNANDTATRTLVLNVTSASPLTTTAKLYNNINLVKTGAGSQTISGVAAVGSLTVQEGMLALTNEASTANGDITVSGGKLNFGGSYTLDERQTLSVLTSTENAVQLGGLTLNGGTMVFDIGALAPGGTSAALKVLEGNAVVMNTAGILRLNYDGGMVATGIYKLASGDWSALGTDHGFTIEGLSYGGVSATLQGTADGLFLNYTATQEKNLYTWIGGAEGNWNTSDAHWDNTIDTPNDNAPFTNSAENAPTHAVFDGGSANVTVGEAIVVDSLSILGGAQVTLGMGDEGASFAANELIVANGKLTLGSKKNWSSINSVTIKEHGVLELDYGTGMNNTEDATNILLQGGTINLRNGRLDPHTTLHADITLDGSGTIAGSRFGDDTTISGTITGDGTLAFAKELVNNNTNVINVSASITDGADGSLALTIKDTKVKLTGTNTYTGGTTIEEGGTLTITNGKALGGTAVAQDGKQNAGYMLGKVAGAGTLVLDTESLMFATGTGDAAHLGTFTGTIDVRSGTLQIGSTKNQDGSAAVDFGAGRVILRDGAAFHTHFGTGGINDITTSRTLAANLDLMAGSKLYNIDGNVTYGGHIRFNVVDPSAATATYDETGVVKLDMYYAKNLFFTGKLEGAGTVQLANAENEAKAVYRINGADNTFSGTFETIDDNGSNANKTIELRLGHQNAAQYADVNLATTTAKSYLLLDSDATIHGLYGVVDAENAVQAQASARTLTVSEGDFGGRLQNSTGTLALIKQGDGTLILRGANTYTGDTTITGGTLELAHAGALNSHVTVNEGALFRLEATSAKTFAKTISGAGTIEKTGAGVLSFTGAQELTALNVQAGYVKANAALTIGTLTVAEGAGFAYDLSSTPTVVTAATYAGGLSLSLSNYSVGQRYDLFRGAAGLTAANVSISGLDSSLYQTTTSVNNGLVSVGVYYTGLAWNAAHENNTWAPGGATNWTSADQAADYADGQQVVFGGTGETITIDGTVAPANVVVDGTGYRFEGGSIASTGSLRVLNAGALTLTQAATFAGGVTIDGALTYDVAADRELSFTGTLAGSGSLNKTGAGTLNLGALTSSDIATTLNVSNGVLKFTGSNSEQHNQSTPDFIQVLKKLNTSGSGKLLIDGSVYYNYTDETAAACLVTVDDCIEVTGNLYINSYQSGNGAYGGFRKYDVTSTASLTVGDRLYLTNNQFMEVNGGSVTAGSISLGHGAGSQYVSKLVINNGQVKTGGILLRHDNASTVTMTGGRLEFAPTDATVSVFLADNGNTNGYNGNATAKVSNVNVSLTGGTLVAAESSWLMDAGTATNFRIYGVTFEVAAEKSITLAGNIDFTPAEGANGTITKTGQGDLVFNVAGKTLAGLSIQEGWVQARQALSVTQLSYAAGTGFAYDLLGGEVGLVTNTAYAAPTDGQKLSLRLSSLATGTYNVFQGSADLRLEDLNLVPYESLGSRATIGWQMSPETAGLVQVVVSVDENPLDLSWNVSHSDNVWSREAVANWNWQKSDDEAVAEVFMANDTVTFSGEGEAVTISGTMTPASVTVNGTGYHFVGDGSIGGTGTLTVANGGELTISTANTYTGGTTIEGGGTLTITTNRALGGSDTNGVLGKLSGAGTLVLALGSGNTAIVNGTGDSANAADFTGTFDVTSGTLRIGVDSGGKGATETTFNAAKVIVRNGGMLFTNFGNGTYDTSDRRTLTSALDLMSGSTLFNQDGCVEFTGNIRFNVKDDGTFDSAGEMKIDQHWQKNLYFSGSLAGSGTVKLSNASVEDQAIYHILSDNNTFDGTYKLVGDDGTNENRTITLHLGAQNAAQYATVNLASSLAKSYLVLDSDATIKGLNGIVDAENQVKASGDYTLTVSEGDFGGALVDDGDNQLSLIKQGDGTLILRGANTYTGDTTITGGTLTLAHAGALDSHVTVNEGALFRLEATGAKTFAKTISGAGSVEKTGAGVLTLTGAHSYTGDTTIKAGTLQLANAATLASNVVVNSGATFELNANAQTMTFGQTISGAGGVKKSGSNDVFFTQDHSYTGATTIEAGKLILDLGTVTTGEGEEAVTTNGIYTLDGDVSGAGTLEVATGTTLKVTDGEHDISSALLVNGGEVEVTAVNGQNIQGNLTVQNGGKLAFTATTGELYDGFVIDNSTHSLTLTNGTLDLGAMRHTFQNWSITMQDGSTIEGTGSSWSGSNNVKAALDVASNNMTISVLANSSESITGTNEISAATRLRGNTLKYNIAEGAALTVSGLIMTDATTGNPGIAKEGAGDLIFTRDHTFVGSTTISGGKLILDLGTVTTGEGNDAVTTNGIYTLDGAVTGTGILQVNTGTTLQVNNAAHTIGTAVNLQADALLQIDVDGEYTISTNITGDGGLSKQGAGTLILSGANTYTGGTTINGGTLQLANAATLASDVVVNSGATLDFYASAKNMLFEQSISGAGKVTITAQLTHDSSNVVTFNKAHTYTGGTVVNSGTLRLTDGASLASGVELTNDSLMEFVAENGDMTFDQTISGVGGVQVDMEHKVTFTKAHTYMGGTVVSKGTLELAGEASLADVSGLWEQAEESGDMAPVHNAMLSIEAGGTLLLNTTEAVTLHQLIMGTNPTSNEEGETVLTSFIHKTGEAHAVLSGLSQVGRITVAGLDDGANAGILSIVKANSLVRELLVAHGAVHVGAEGQVKGNDVQVTRLEMGACGAGETTSQLVVHEDSSLTVVESAHLATNAADTELTVKGALLAEHAQLTMGAAKTTITIDGGTLAAQGMADMNPEQTGAGLDLSLTNGGKLILGADGLSTAQTTNIQLDKGTVGMTADMTLAEDMTLTSAEGTTFDTSKYIYDRTPYDYDTNEGYRPIVQRVDEAGTMTVTGNISSAAEGEAAKMNVVGAGMLQLNGNAALSGGLEVEQGATVQVGDVFSMQFNMQSADATADATTAATTAATVGGPVRITQATEGTATAISGTGTEKTRMEHSLITIEQRASLTVENMLVSDTSRITGATGTPAAQTYATREGGNNIDVSQVKVVNTTIELSQNNAQVAAGDDGSTTTSITLGQLQAVGTSDASGALTLSGASNVMTVNSNAMSNLLVLNGSSFVVDFSYLLNAIQLKDVDFIYLDFASVNYQNLAGSTISATMDGHTIQAYFAGAGAAPNVPNVGVYFDVSAIPEPTTTTLSILALAALAVRRRRK